MTVRTDEDQDPTQTANRGTPFEQDDDLPQDFFTSVDNPLHYVSIYSCILFKLSDFYYFSIIPYLLLLTVPSNLYVHKSFHYVTSSFCC